MAKVIRLSKSVIGDEEKKAVTRVLDKEFLGMGEEVKIFEENLKKIFSREVVCVSSGTAAIQLAIEACNIGVNDEILVPSLTYVATFQAITATGAKPIPCDVYDDTCLLNLDDARSKLTRKTKAIIPVHYTGGVGNLAGLFEFAKENKLRVIEDAAHAFGTKYNSKLIGSFGDVTCFSFDGIKNITSGEGGCILSDDKSVIENIKNSRLLGVERDSDNRYENKRSWNFDVTRQGWRYHMSNIMAAIGIEQLKKMKYFSNKRKEIARLYDGELNSNLNIIPLERDYDNVVPHIYVVRIKDLKDRDELRNTIYNYGIELGIHYNPNHYLSFFKSDKNSRLPITEKIYKEIISLPIHPDITKQDVKHVVSTLNYLLPNFLKK